MKSLLVLLSLVFAFSAAADPSYESLSKILSPYIKGDTLFIEGRMDSHVYNYLAYEAKAVEKIKYISVNSYGGNHNWTLEAAKKIQELNKITILKKGNVCASACVYLFAAGKERIMEESTWLGVHGARLSGAYATNFYGLCFVDLEDGSVFMEKKKGCNEFLTSWYDISYKATSLAFDLMESNGISLAARQYYFSLEDDPNWHEHLNILKKPDWVISPEEAIKYNFATQIQ